MKNNLLKEVITKEDGKRVLIIQKPVEQSETELTKELERYQSELAWANSEVNRLQNLITEIQENLNLFDVKEVDTVEK